MNSKKLITLNYMKPGYNKGYRFSTLLQKVKQNLFLDKSKKKIITTTDGNTILNTNNERRKASNRDLYNLSNNLVAASGTNLLNNKDIESNTNLLNNNNNQNLKKSNKNLKLVETNLRKKVPLTHKIYNGDYKKKANEKKNHLNYNNFCDICLSSISAENTAETINLSCGHFYCRECIRDYIKDSIIKINSKNLNSSSKCPKPVCGAAIPKSEIEEILKDDEKNLAKFHKCLKKIEMINNFNNLIVCPIADCDSFAKRELIEKNFATCENNHKFCVKCNKLHNSKSCFGLSPDESATEKFLKNSSDVKKCPKCATLLYKFPDCKTNIVKCGYELCDYDYCWLCGRFPEKTHYTNPLSSCYKLEKIDNKHVLATNNCLRMTKYFIIVLLTMMIIPFLIIFSTFLFVTFFILAFVPDGSVVKHIKMKTKGLQPLFQWFVTGIYVAMAFPLVPLGYMLQASFIVLSPLILVYKKCISYKALYF